MLCGQSLAGDLARAGHVFHGPELAIVLADDLCVEDDSMGGSGDRPVLRDDVASWCARHETAYQLYYRWQDFRIAGRHAGIDFSLRIPVIEFTDPADRILFASVWL